MLNQEEYGRKMSQLIARCWADESFKRKFLADPEATLKAEGAELPAGVSIKALENTDNVVHLVIPAKPTELSDEDLDKVAAGEMCVPGPEACYGPEGKQKGGGYKLYCASACY
jgi:hypothetical protein